MAIKLTDLWYRAGFGFWAVSQMPLTEQGNAMLLPFTLHLNRWPTQGVSSTKCRVIGFNWSCIPGQVQGPTPHFHSTVAWGRSSANGSGLCSAINHLKSKCIWVLQVMVHTNYIVVECVTGEISSLKGLPSLWVEKCLRNEVWKIVRLRK